MKDAQIARLLRRIALTSDTEIDCGECSKLSPQFVEAILNGHDRADGGDRWAAVRVHIEQCPVCSQEVLTLGSILKMDQDGTWPPLTALLDRACRRDDRPQA